MEKPERMESMTTVTKQRGSRSLGQGEAETMSKQAMTKAEEAAREKGRDMADAEDLRIRRTVRRVRENGRNMRYIGTEPVTGDGMCP